MQDANSALDVQFLTSLQLVGIDSLCRGFKLRIWRRTKLSISDWLLLATKRMPHQGTPGQIAVACVRHQGKDVVPILGTTKAKNLEENIGALAVPLSKEKLKKIDDAVPQEDVGGSWCPEESIRRFSHTGQS
ncbi:unnamed protein product [Calypogeia fissa]